MEREKRILYFEKICNKLVEKDIKKIEETKSNNKVLQKYELNNSSLKYFLFQKHLCTISIESYFPWQISAFQV